MRFLHWLGHVVFDMDCAVYVLNGSNRLYCKKCGRDVSMKVKARKEPR